jgi:hypothetical protein
MSNESANRFQIWTLSRTNIKPLTRSGFLYWYEAGEPPRRRKYLCYYYDMKARSLRQFRLSKKFTAVIVMIPIVLALLYGATFLNDKRLIIAHYGPPANSDPCPNSGLARGADTSNDPVELAFQPHAGDYGWLNVLGGFDYRLQYRPNGQPFEASGAVDLFGHIHESANFKRSGLNTSWCLLQ